MIGIRRVVLGAGFVLLAAGGLLLPAGGCATQPQAIAEDVEPAQAPDAPDAPDALEAPGVPEDLIIDAIVRCGRDWPEQATANLRPGRFVLFPDGSLHYGSPERGQRSVERFPEPVRVLGRREMEKVWRLAGELGLTDASAYEGPSSATGPKPPRDGILYVLDFTAEGERWAITTSSGEASAASSPAARLVRTLAELSWVSDRPDPQRTVLPTRYDLGPDPYERFRRP